MSLRDVLGLFATDCVNVPFLKTTLQQNCLHKNFSNRRSAYSALIVKNQHGFAVRFDSVNLIKVPAD